MRRGLTLVELLIAIGIFCILLLVGVWHWSFLNKSQALIKDRLGLISLFEEARTLSISSKSNSSFGVNVSSTTAEVFQGNTWTGSNTILNVYNFNSQVQVSAVNLAGGGYNIFFSRLTGETVQTGTIKISLINTPTSSTTITILGSGVVQ